MALPPMIGVVSQSALGISSRSFSFLQIIENTKVNGRALIAYAGVPFAEPVVKTNPVDARMIAMLQTAIAHIFGSINRPKIDQAIVVTVPVYMVDDMRPLAITDRPYNPVSGERLPKEGAEKVSVLPMRGERWLVRATGVPLAAAQFIARKISRLARVPHQRARFRVMADLLAKVVNVGHLMLSHIERSMFGFGQGRTALVAPSRSVFHSRISHRSQAMEDLK